MGWYWNPLGAFGLATGLVMLALASLVFFTSAHRPQSRRLALVLLIDSTGALLGTGIVYLTDDYGIAHGAQAATYAFAFPILLAYLWFLASLPAPAAAPLRWRGLGWVLMAAGVAYFVFFLARTELFLAGMAPSPYSRLEGVHGPLILPLVSIPLMMVLAYGLVVALSMWLQSPRGTVQRRQGAAYAVAFMWRDLGILYLLLALFVFNLYSTFVAWSITVTLAIYPLLIAYALLKFQLFDLDLKIKWTIRRGTVAGIFVAAFFVVLAVAEQFLQQYGVIAGGVAVGLLFLAVKPIERAADRFVDRALPAVKDTPEYRTVRKVEVYRAAVEAALVDGAVTEKERDILATLAEKIGLTHTEARTIERDAARVAVGS